MRVSKAEMPFLTLTTARTSYFEGALEKTYRRSQTPRVREIGRPLCVMGDGFQGCGLRVFARCLRINDDLESRYLEASTTAFAVAVSR
jgi:hypothetical protein